MSAVPEPLSARRDPRWWLLVGAAVGGVAGALALPWIETAAGFDVDGWVDDGARLVRLGAAAAAFAVGAAAVAARAGRLDAGVALRAAAVLGAGMVAAGMSQIVAIAGPVELEVAGAAGISARILPYVAELLAPGAGVWGTIAAGAVALALGLGPLPRSGSA